MNLDNVVVCLMELDKGFCFGVYLDKYWSSRVCYYGWCLSYLVM